MNKIREKISYIIPERIKHYYRLFKNPRYKTQFKLREEINRLMAYPRYEIGTSTLLNHTVHFIDASSLVFIYDEIFNKEIYKFHTDSPYPYIIDAGANIGLSVIYFKQLFPQAEIVAFEPDEKVFQTLEYNVRSFDLERVTLFQKALWNEEKVLEFVLEGADAGRIAFKQDTGQIVRVDTMRLRPFLDRRVDFLKIDIEGAETSVLQDCRDLLKNVEKLFVEYHSFAEQPQDLHMLLDILHSAGFRYNIQHIGVFSAHPFIRIDQYLQMDLQLNIFAYRL